MEIVLVGREAELTRAWQRECGGLAGVSVTDADIVTLDVDAVLSPANSFGFMRGGVDLAYAQAFGPHLEPRVRAAIAARWGGELPVGCAEVVATAPSPGAGPIPWLVVAPTMRVPARIEGTVHPYLAARAALRLVRDGAFPTREEEYGAWAGRPVHDAVQRIALPGLGTGTGQVPPGSCARQVRAAIEEVRDGLGGPPHDMGAAIARHLGLTRGDGA